jgi:hypothetical protein
LDLTGLPPTVTEIDAFVRDNSPYACETVVDRLLQSRAYGERWARHWLDLTGYADMMGTSNDVFAEHSWRYRDYVIEALAKDKPFDRFIREQIAGDLLPAGSIPEQAENITATGFLVVGDVEIVEPEKAKMEADHVDTQVSKIGAAFLGMTLGCARCHDHKFDPIGLTDYYGIAGMLRSSPSTHKIPFGVWSKLNATELPETPEQLAKRQKLEAEHAVNLPSFVSIHAPNVRTYTSGFLPAKHQGTPLTVPLNDQTLPIENLRNASSSETIQRQRIDLTKRWNQRLLDDLHGDANMEGMIENMELAFRMQTTTPQLVDLSQESKETMELYGIDGKESDKNGRACLLARKLSESGVRFVQVTMDGWDHHGDIRGNLPRLCQQTDQPVAGLIRDLKQRGLLDETLVLWSGEFGRTPWSQDLSGTAPIDKHGREHQPESFCAWMCGGGVKRGLTYGATDEMGYRVIDGKIHIHDLHATMLHLLGIDHTELTWNQVGRNYRLTDVYGNVVKEILS